MCVMCRMFSPHNFVSESIYFLLNSEPKLWKQKWKPGEEQTFSPSIMGCVSHVKASLPFIPWVSKIPRLKKE